MEKVNSTQVILNGINFKNLEYTNLLNYAIPTFITLGCDFYRKGDEFYFGISKRLNDKGYKFKIVINGKIYK